jgi:hypothetical protein
LGEGWNGDALRTSCMGRFTGGARAACQGRCGAVSWRPSWRRWWPSWLVGGQDKRTEPFFTW